MDRDYLGPFCLEISLSKNQIDDLSIEALGNENIKNGLLFELQAYLKNLNQVVEVLKRLQPELLSANPSSLKTKINRLIETKKKLVSKKKVSGISSVNELNSKLFGTPSKKKLFVTPRKNVEISGEDSLSLLHESGLVSPRQNDTENCTAEIPDNSEKNENSNEQNLVTRDMTDRDDVKSRNELSFKIIKQQKHLKALTSLVENEKMKIEQAQRIKGHFSVRNVTKRDENAKKTRKKLFTANSKLLELTRQNERLLLKQNEMTVALTEALTEIKSLKRKTQSTENEIRKKVNAQKLNTYYRSTLQKLRESPNPQNKTTEELKQKLKKKDQEIELMQTDNEILHEQLRDKNHHTRNVDGTFCSEMRLCVMELFSLEIGVEKISQAINTVSKHLFQTEFEKSDLPSNSTVQCIIDEGHYLAKAFIADSLEQCSNFGISRDDKMSKR